jgi:hypothetical protein
VFIFQVFHHTVPHAPPRIIQLFPTQPLPAPLHRLPNSKGRCPYYYVAVGAAAGPASAGRLPAQSFPYLEHYTDFCASSPAPSSSAFPVSIAILFLEGSLSLSIFLREDIRYPASYHEFPRPLHEEAIAKFTIIGLPDTWPDSVPIDRDLSDSCPEL